MAYEVTATKKRPQNFDALAGQEFVVATLKNSVKSGRIAHAYLFSGPRGVGKTSAARILAKALNCENGPTDEPCGSCHNCLEITQGNSLDVIEIDGASNTSVNDVRAIKDEVLFAPNSSRYKIYIIDEVHMLSNSAFNALLKTIEEPPPYIIFIFATTEIHKVPATIRSRCQQFNFRLIGLDVIKNLLDKACLEYQIHAESDALYWISKEAMGSLRDAYTLFDQVLSFTDSNITLEKIREILGLVGLDSINSFTELLCSGDSKAALEMMDEILTQGVSVEQFIIDLAEYFRNILFIKNKVEKESILGYSVTRFSKKVRQEFSVPQLEQALNLLLTLYRNIRYSLNQRYELELLVSRLAQLESFIPPQEILARIDHLKKQIQGGGLVPQTRQSALDPSGPLQTAVPQPEQAAVEPPVDLAERVKELIQIIKKKKLALSSTLEKAVLWDTQNDRLFITFDSSYPANFVRKELSYLNDKIEQVFGQRYTLEIKLDEEKKNSHEEIKPTNSQVELVKKVFRGEVVKGG